MVGVVAVVRVVVWTVGVGGVVGGLCVFFFQAEDGIRDYDVTGVQTCALPILEVPMFDVQLAMLGYISTMYLNKGDLPGPPGSAQDRKSVV